MPETRRYQYIYAILDEDDMCVEVRDTTIYCEDPNYIPIPAFNEEYIMRYYNRDNGKWYEDAEFTIEWLPS